jgi:hypothetical protein
MLPLALYGCEIQSLTPRTIMFESKELRRMLGNGKGEVTGRKGK